LETNKSKYIDFCLATPDLPIFVQPWYLEAVCQTPKQTWSVALVEKGQHVAAALPYFSERKGPFSISAMPHLTKYLGPHLAKDFRHQRQVLKMYKALIEQLPPFSFFSQNAYYTVDNWLPFYWKGFDQTVRYSYVIHGLDDLDTVWENISSNYRNNKIKKAEQIVRIVSDRSIDDFYALQKMSFDRQNLAMPFSLDFLKQYDQIVDQHRARQLFFAVDEQDQIHSAAYLLIDQDRSYFHMVGDNPDLRNSGAGILVAWKAIEYTAKTLGLKIFDFEGSMIPAIERVRREFGAEQVPYFTLTTFGSKLYQAYHILSGR
jgi:hypothetical protein